jgi:large subunit ribosomal protein L22
MATSTTVINKSPRKVRLIIDHLRGKNLSQALLILKTMNKEKTKHVYNLLKSAATNLGATEGDYSQYTVSSIVAEEAQRLYRMIPRARGSSAKIRRRYSRVKVDLEMK